MLTFLARERLDEALTVPLDRMCKILPTRLLLKHTPDIFMRHLSIID